MSDILLIGKCINQALESSSAVVQKIGKRIFPIVAPDGTLFPFIVYTRANAYSASITKDGFCGDKGSFQIVIASDSYTEAVELANDVRKVIENNDISSDGLNIGEIHMTSAGEAYSDDTYMQTLYFECEAED